ncbi:hypothetical protein F5J12DRAFT_904895 [Pisolithus orientalis]|uniref:uncharacterized protein n=1 Tax=Pisolithus orientalis TaxID=936130 RepID=UPI002223F536|nr:uncharacterized protein F5J12DRAFT_904895 [Pisolithus orientalis]KAI6010745.1 hypothetical protein F5J12DRAFT_904895 [Pisolithus orientalis]
MHCLQDVVQIHVCTLCQKSLTASSPWQPKDTIANFQHYGDVELPLKVQESIQCASLLELMLVAASFYKNQCFNRDLTGLSTVLPLMWCNLCGAVCMVFAGGAFHPTAEALCKLLPVLVSKRRVKSMIEWLISNNEWYMKKGIMFSKENLTWLGTEITHLHNEDGLVDANGSVDWSVLATDLIMESVAYTDGNHSEHLQWAMKATTLAHALSHKKFIVSCSGLELLNKNLPGYLTVVFPHLDPWGIGGFNHPAQQPDQQISFQ